MKIVFVADAHLKGASDPNLKSLADFLDGLGRVDTLVVLGDLFDFWTGANEKVYKEYRIALESLMGLKKRGVNIIYLEGNHDFSMGEFFTKELGAGVHPGFFEWTLDGKRVLLAHGDTVSMTRGYALWRRFLRSPVFRFITRVAPPGFVWTTANLLSRKSRKYNQEGNIVEERLREFARERIGSGFDTVILAHSHVAGVHKEEANGRKGAYANPGSWAGGGSYLVYEKGALKVARGKR
ncbi:MAG: UDP-2,3-diacylglucosamine diphosphatase [Deltaproteobacteria bacterium]|nr:UDP-2,3-diacylglucosamine diphosphatase [Deltaproteobacteria bacterium]